MRLVALFEYHAVFAYFLNTRMTIGYLYEKGVLMNKVSSDTTRHTKMTHLIIVTFRALFLKF